MRHIFIAIIALLLFGCQEKSGQSLVFERVVDGDTFIASGKRIRIWGIDAPERDAPDAYAAAMYLEVLINSGKLECVMIDRDRYLRDVAQCKANGKDIAADLVRMGMATDYKIFSKGYYDPQEREAKAYRRGIWADLGN